VKYENSYVYEKNFHVYSHREGKKSEEKIKYRGCRHKVREHKITEQGHVNHY
jgi:hypothetical protein